MKCIVPYHVFQNWMNHLYGRNQAWMASSWNRLRASSARITRTAFVNAWSGMPSPAILFEPNRLRVHEYTT